MFICPVCKNELNKAGKSFICSNGHCFDMAKSGYVNLLLKSTGGNHGDNKLMVSARRDFRQDDFMFRANLIANPFMSNDPKLCRYDNRNFFSAQRKGIFENFKARRSYAYGNSA